VALLFGFVLSVVLTVPYAPIMFLCIYCKCYSLCSMNMRGIGSYDKLIYDSGAFLCMIRYWQPGGRIRRSEK